jgi:hypothetical protein
MPGEVKVLIKAVINSALKKKMKREEAEDWNSIKTLHKTNKPAIKQIATMIALGAFSEGKEKPMNGHAVHFEEVPQKVVVRLLAQAAEKKNPDVTVTSIQVAYKGDYRAGHKVMYMVFEVLPGDKKIDKERDIPKFIQKMLARGEDISNGMIGHVTFDPETGEVDWNLSGWFLRMGPNVLLDRRQNKTKELANTPPESAKFETNWIYSNATLVWTSQTDGSENSLPLATWFLDGTTAVTVVVKSEQQEGAAPPAPAPALILETMPMSVEANGTTGGGDAPEVAALPGSSSSSSSGAPPLPPKKPRCKTRKPPGSSSNQKENVNGGGNPVM